MDTSETYIKMCEKVPFELNFRPGDHIYSYDRKRVEILIDFEQLIGNLNPTKLYHQDQLQEMLMLNIPQEETFYFLRDFTLGHLKKYPESWEQIWLIAVMKTKFNKIWNGESWVEKE